MQNIDERVPDHDRHLRQQLHVLCVLRASAFQNLHVQQSRRLEAVTTGCNAAAGSTTTTTRATTCWNREAIRALKRALLRLAGRSSVGRHRR